MWRPFTRNSKNLKPDSDNSVPIYIPKCWNGSMEKKQSLINYYG